MYTYTHGYGLEHLEMARDGDGRRWRPWPPLLWRALLRVRVVSIRTCICICTHMHMYLAAADGGLDGLDVGARLRVVVDRRVGILLRGEVGRVRVGVGVRVGVRVRVRW